MIDTTTKEYRINLARGHVEKSLIGKETTYKLPSILPSITDFTYNIETDSWVRTRDIKLEHGLILVKEHNIIVQEGKWSSYSNTEERGRKKVISDGGRYLLDEHNNRILDVETLKPGNTTCYIASVFLTGILDTILGDCISEVTNRYSFVDVHTYMKLRSVCKLFRNRLDTSFHLSPHRKRLIDYVGGNFTIDIGTLRFVPISMCIYALRYANVDLLEMGDPLIPHVCNCLDQLREENDLENYRSVSNRLLCKSNKRPITFHVSWLPIISRLCVKKQEIDIKVCLINKNGHKMYLILGNLLDKQLCKVVEITNEVTPVIIDITANYTFEVSEEIQDLSIVSLNA